MARPQPGDRLRGHGDSECPLRVRFLSLQSGVGGNFLGSSQAFWDAPSFWKEGVSMCIAGQDVHSSHSSAVTQREGGRGMS